MKPQRMIRLLFCLALFSLSGCGSGGPETAQVSGTVMLDGKPVPAAMLTFRPEDPAGSPSYGVTDADGKYSLMFTRDRRGAMLGKHHVEIATQRISAEEAADMKAEGQEVPNYVAIPKKYREPGALTAEVNRGSNPINFELKSQ